MIFPVPKSILDQLCTAKFLLTILRNAPDITLARNRGLQESFSVGHPRNIHEFCHHPQCTAVPQRAREREAFYDAPVNLGLQPIKLLALEPFEIEHQGRSNSIEKQICVFSGVIFSLTLAALMSTFRTLSPQFVHILLGREPGSPIHAACKILAEIASVCAVHLDPSRSGPLYGESGKYRCFAGSNWSNEMFNRYPCFYSLRISLCGFTMFSSMKLQMYSST